MKCRRCRGGAVIELRQHNAAFCQECFLRHASVQVERAIHEHKMIAEGERCLVAVSGGKDSLALWDLLSQLGYGTQGVHINLGIGSYSDHSESISRAFAEERGLPLDVVDLSADFGYNIEGGSRAARRPPCSVCGTSKRHILNAHAVEHGYEVLATGHNLDDESATLLGNLLHWQVGYVARQGATLPERSGGFARKVKPLIRLGEKETAAYCFLKGIEYVVEECPMVAGNTGLRYKDALALLEAESPGTRSAFMAGFLKHGRPLFDPESGGEPELVACSICSSPTPATGGEPVCAFCALQRRAQATPVSIKSRDERGE